MDTLWITGALSRYKRDLLLWITPDFLWITLLELCIKLVQTGGKGGDGMPQICGEFVGREPQIVGTGSGQSRAFD